MAATPLSDRYDLLDPLGKGSFAHTWRARDRSNDAIVALKVLDPRSADWKARELFEREAQVLAGLRHPAIPAMYGTMRVEWEGAECPCLAMEYVEGDSLGTVIATRRRLGDEEAVGIFVDLLGILDYLHTRVPPVVHRDIKPANVILRPGGGAALVDFGSVREGFAAGDEAGSTVAGTYGYMPYEQYMGQALPSSDLYALAATMLHLLTGRAPREFMGPEGRLSVPAELVGGAHLRGVLARMLAPSPADRFPAARDVQRALVIPHALPVAASGSAAASAVTAVSTARRAAPAITLPPAPRELTGATRERFDAVAYSMWELLEAGDKPSGRTTLFDIATFTFFSLITVGILPLVFFSMARTRRRQLARFFRDGELTTAVILDIQTEKPAFDVPITRVQYEFTTDGVPRRDSDTVLPTIANGWRVGDTIQVLVLRERGHHSIIASAE